MWRRMGVASRGESREASLSCPSDISGEEDHRIDRKNPQSLRRHLHGVHGHSSPEVEVLSAPESCPADRHNMRGEGESWTPAVAATEGVRGSGHVRGKVMLTARRWTSRHKLSELETSSASESPGPVDFSQPKKMSTFRGCAGSRRQHNSGNTTVTGLDSNSTKLSQRLRKRRPFPLREQLLRWPPPFASDNDLLGDPADVADTNVSTNVSSPSSKSLPRLVNPERLVASSPRPRVETEPLLSSSPATSTASEAPGWAERTGLADLAAGGAVGVGGEDPTSSTTLTLDNKPNRTNNEVVLRERDVPRFLRPVILLLTLSILAIVGTKIWRGGWEGLFGLNVFGPAVHAAGGAHVPEAVVDDIFDRADKDNDGVIADAEIQCLVEGAGGALLDDASEIAAGVASVIKHLDLNEDDALTRSDLLTYWKRLGKLLTVDEVAEWVVHAAQLPKEVADTFRSNMVTGYDFPELAAKQGALLEQDLGITRPAFRKRLVRSMKWKLWGMGEEPTAPHNFRARNTSCGTLTLEWDRREGEGNLSFPVHKFVLRRARTKEGGQGDPSKSRGAGAQWTTVMEGSNRLFFDSRLKPGAGYRYSLQAWNALGHSDAVEIDVVVATDDCMTLQDGYWWPGGAGFASLRGMLGAVLVLIVSSFYLLSYLPLQGNKRGRKHGDFYDGKSSSNGERRPEALSEGRGLGVVPAMVSGSLSSPLSSAGRGWSDRELPQDENSEPTRMLSWSGTQAKPSTKKSGNNKASRGLLRTNGAPVKSRSRKVKGASEAVTGTLMASEAVGKGLRPDLTVGVESMRKEAARRLMSHQSNSRDDPEVCGVCGREFKWFNRRSKHTCCKCHEFFCDKCGVVSHALWACPVGGSCMCNTCGADGAHRRSSH